MDYVKIPTRWPDYKSKKQIREEIPDAIQFVVNSKEGCAWFDLDQHFDDLNYYAIVIGWGDCDNPNFQDDEYYERNHRISIKIGANPVDSVSQSGFYEDWPQLIKHDTGEVWDTEMWLFPESNLNETLDWLFSEWEAMEEYMNNKED